MVNAAWGLGIRYDQASKDRHLEYRRAVWHIPKINSDYVPALSRI
ncbi:MAG: hypothetical protein OJF51_000144 [Nitrospira sp.]|nr:MAG: hypothetical protein OJF51_000144 [Nitrospira sp.]